MIEPVIPACCVQWKLNVPASLNVRGKSPELLSGTSATPVGLVPSKLTVWKTPELFENVTDDPFVIVIDFGENVLESMQTDPVGQVSPPVPPPGPPVPPVLPPGPVLPPPE